MSNRSIGLDDALLAYLLEHGVREAPLLAELRRETAALPMARMQISPEQGAFMGLLVELLAPRRCLEIGVFTGYSALAVALRLPTDGLITACDINDDWTQIARRYWQRAGVAEKIHLHLGPANDTLDALLRDGAADTYDFAFIDADKENYETYYEKSLALLRPGGLLIADNVLWSGRVLDNGDHEASTKALRAFNRARIRDERVSIAMAPIADGLTLMRKR